MIVDMVVNKHAPMTRELAWQAENAMLRVPPVWGTAWAAGPLMRMARDLHAAADTGHELHPEHLRSARDLMGLLGGW